MLTQKQIEIINMCWLADLPYIVAAGLANVKGVADYEASTQLYNWNTTQAIKLEDNIVQRGEAYDRRVK